ncbi:MAG: nucleoside phosphorylase [Myxococcales bacterium]|nr:uridine phosphorylase [Myxococcales bacterium]HIK84921.1 uridine phosphorylase [Myxococcales bacterium]
MSDAQPITGCSPGDIAERVFLCGDPARIDRITEGWDSKREVCAAREYLIVTGEKNGVALSAASHGIGAPSTAVLIEELIKLGAKTMIRIGNSGGLDPKLELGDLAITTGSVRDDGTSKAYVIPEYPAVAHWEIVGALVGAAANRKVRAKTGVTWSLDAFYVRNAVAGPNDTMQSMSVDGYWPSHLEARIRDMQQARILNCEMETGILLTLASLFGIRAGAICVVSDRTPWPGPNELDINRNMTACIDVATEAMLSLT